MEVCMEDTEDTDTDMASVRLRLIPRPVLIPTTWEDMEDTEDTEDTAWDTLVWDTPPWDTLVSDTEVYTEDTDTDTASVRLRLSPRLMLRPVLIPTTWEDMEDTEDTEDTPWDTLVSDMEVCTEDTDTDTASVRLRLSPRLM